MNSFYKIFFWNFDGHCVSPTEHFAENRILSFLNFEPINLGARWVRQENLWKNWIVLGQAGKGGHSTSCPLVTLCDDISLVVWFLELLFTRQLQKSIVLLGMNI